MAADGPKQIVFVGGAPRSGTTVTQALICTGEGVNAYCPEVSFLRGFVNAFQLGSAAWKRQTSAYFAEPVVFRDFMREVTDLALGRIWDSLGRTPILCVKDPHLTPHFPDIHILYSGEVKFVTVCRHPFAVVRSRQEVHEKSGAARPFGIADVEQIAQEYFKYYHAVLKTKFGGRHFMFRYEDLNTDRIRDGLRGFVGVESFDVARMWQDGRARDDTPWGSPKYNQPIDLEPRLSPLPEAFLAPIRSICGPIMERFDYS
jgi:hypothetical protein